MGKMETGSVTTTDPAMGQPVTNSSELKHPILPESITKQLAWWEGKKQCVSKRSQYKSFCKDFC